MVYEQQLAEKIYRILQDHLLPDGPDRLKKVVVRCGELDCPDPRSLTNYWHETAAGGAYQGSYIELHRDQATAKCAFCNHTFEIDGNTTRCPNCRYAQFKIVHQPPVIEALELE